MAELTFTYRFILDEDREEMFRVRLDSHTLDPVDELETPLPAAGVSSVRALSAEFRYTSALPACGPDCTCGPPV